MIVLRGMSMSCGISLVALRLLLLGVEATTLHEQDRSRGVAPGEWISKCSVVFGPPSPVPWAGPDADEPAPGATAPGNTTAVGRN